ncbi:MAG: hypothetical protein AAF824_04570 [Bacteroidota bacterium]
MRKEIGKVRDANNRTFTAFWNSDTQEVYLRPERAALLTAFKTVGKAFNEEEAMNIASQYIHTHLLSWA